MNGVDVEAIYSRLGSIESLLGHLTTESAEIKKQVKATNGRVNKHDTELELIKERHKTCPSLVAHKKTVNTSVGRFSNIIAIAAVCISMLSTILVILIK